MPYWDHEGETQGIASPLRDSYNKGKMPGLSLRWTGLFSFMCPPRLSEKSRREQKSLYPTTGATTDSQSSLGVLLLLRQSPPHTDCLKSLDESRKVCTPTTGATTNSQSSLGVLLLLLLRQSPSPQVSARVFSGCISGVCLQWCFQGASQVFAIDGNGHRPCKRLWHSQPFLT